MATGHGCAAAVVLSGWRGAASAGLESYPPGHPPAPAQRWLQAPMRTRRSPRAPVGTLLLAQCIALVTLFPVIFKVAKLASVLLMATAEE